MRAESTSRRSGLRVRSSWPGCSRPNIATGRSDVFMVESAVSVESRSSRFWVAVVHWSMRGIRTHATLPGGALLPDRHLQGRGIAAFLSRIVIFKGTGEYQGGPMIGSRIGLPGLQLRRRGTAATSVSPITERCTAA